MAIDGGYTITPLSGKNGTSGDSIYVQYAPTDTTPQGQRHDTFQSGDKYMWQKVGDGSWSSAMKIVGEDGKNAITMTSATTPSGEYNGQIGFWQGQPYMWNGSTWDKQTGDLPTDAVLHYSFDEVPDYPDGTADVRLLDNNTYDIQNTNYRFRNNSGATFSNNNGNLEVVTVASAVNYGAYISSSYTHNKIIKIKLEVLSLTENGKIYVRNGADFTVFTISKAGVYEVTFINDSTSQYPSVYFFTSRGATSDFIVQEIYIGDGSYSTPIIDNANGEYQTTQTKGFTAQQGVSGKGIYFPNILSGETGFKLPAYNTSKSMTISLWAKFENSSNVTGALGLVANGSFQTALGLAKKYNASLGVIITAIARTPNKEVTVTSGVNEGQWNHIVALFANDHRIYLYINGVYINRSNVMDSAYQYTETNWILNKKSAFYDSSLSGNNAQQTIDDLLIFDRALSETEVLALYQNKANTPKYYDLSDYSIEQIDDDNVVDHLTEKPQLLSKWLEIYNAKNVSSALPTSNISASGEYKGVIDSANEVGVIETDAVQAYITASNALRSVLWGTNGYLVDMNKDSALSGSLDSLFSTYRQTLQKARTVISEQQASSASALTIVNSNPFCLIPVNAGGTVTTYENTGLRLQVFNGVTQLTPKASSATLSEGQWKVTANGSNVTAGSQTVGNGYIDFGNVSALNADTAVITFTITALVNGVTNTLYTTQKFSKSKEGADGRIYTLLPDYTAVKKSADGSVLTPSSVTVQAKSWTGSSTPALYSSGDLKAFENDVQIGSTVSQGNTITVSPTGSYPVVIKLFVHGTNTLLDTLTIPVLQEVKGDTGRGLVSSVEKYKLSSNLTEPFNESTASSWTDTASSVPTAQLPYLHHAVLQTYSEAPLNEYGDDVIIREYVTNGANGTSTRYSSVSATSSTTSIALNTITGSTAVVGDVIIANSLLFVVTAVGSTNATVQYKQSLKGADNKGISVLLSNQNPNVPSNSDGSSPVLTNTVTNVRVYENTTELKYDASSTANGYYKITVTATGCTHTSITDKGDYAQVNAISAMSADSATRSLAISGKRSDGTSFSFNVVQTITKEKQGLDGYSPSASVTKSGGVATITVTDKTGTTQETVSDGDDALSVTLSTDTIEVLCGNGDGLASGAQSATIKIYARKGSGRVAVPVSAITVPNWTRASYGVQFSKTAGSSSADGYVTVSIDNGATLNTGATAIVTGTLSVTVENHTFSFTLTFKKVTKGCYLGRTGATPSSSTVTVYTSTTELTGGGVNKFAFAGDYVSVIAGNDIGKIFMYNGASWVADNNVGHGTSAFSDLLMIPDSLPSDSSSELILKRLITNEVLAKRMTALEVRFKNFVASLMNENPNLNDQMIFMGKNPYSEIDNDFHFGISKVIGKSDNDLSFRDLLYTEIKNEDCNLSLYGGLEINKSSFFNEDARVFSEEVVEVSDIDDGYGSQILFIDEVYYLFSATVNKSQGKIILSINPSSNGVEFTSQTQQFTLTDSALANLLTSGTICNLEYISSTGYIIFTIGSNGKNAVCYCTYDKTIKSFVGFYRLKLNCYHIVNPYGTQIYLRSTNSSNDSVILDNRFVINITNLSYKVAYLKWINNNEFACSDSYGYSTFYIGNINTPYKNAYNCYGLNVYNDVTLYGTITAVYVSWYYNGRFIILAQVNTSDTNPYIMAYSDNNCKSFFVCKDKEGSTNFANALSAAEDLLILCVHQRFYITDSFLGLSYSSDDLKTWTSLSDYKSTHGACGCPQFFERDDISEVYIPVIRTGSNYWNIFRRKYVNVGKIPKYIRIRTSAPANPVDGDIWID